MKLKKILGCIRCADRDYDMITDGDRIALGLSGGKDSALLLYALDLYRRFSGKQFTIIAIHIDSGFGDDITALAAYFQDRGLEVLTDKTLIARILDRHRHNERLDCSLCANLRKGALIKMAQEQGCNKLALAHNADDAVETLLMNAIHGGRLATFLPVQPLSRSGITMIRPLIYAYEEEIANTAAALQLPIVTSRCPNAGTSQRQVAKMLLRQLYGEYPQAKTNFLRMLSNTSQVALWEKLNKQ